LKKGGRGDFNRRRQPTGFKSPAPTFVKGGTATLHSAAGQVRFFLEIALNDPLALTRENGDAEGGTRLLTIG